MMLQKASPVALQSEQFFLSMPIKINLTEQRKYSIDKTNDTDNSIITKATSRISQNRCVKDYTLTGSTRLSTQMGWSHFIQKHYNRNKNFYQMCNRRKQRQKPKGRMKSKHLEKPVWRLCRELHQNSQQGSRNSRYPKANSPPARTNLNV